MNVASHTRVWDRPVGPVPAFWRLAALWLALPAMAGCSVSAISTAPDEIGPPETWARGGDAGEVEAGWSASFEDPILDSLIAESIETNFSLEQERQRLRAARQSVLIERSQRLPDFTLSLDGSRRGSEDAAGVTSTASSYDASLGGSFEVDLWGRLSKSQQAAELAYAAREASLRAAERDLVSTTAGRYFDVMQASQLLDVAGRRLEIAEESHDIVASGYRQGLNDALDLYLARNQVESARANLAQQEQTRLEAIASLQLALGRYPDGSLAIAAELPVLSEPIPVGLPSEVLTRRPDVMEAWLNLLAADADLAVAHRARFPSLSLVGSGGVSSSELSDLLDGSTGWSLAAGVTQPLFLGGRLAAQEDLARTQVTIAEQAWLDRVYLAFAEVENAISQSASLEVRYEALLEAEKNSQAALELALDQYQRGLVTYTTVLESQRQAFDAAATVVQLKNQRLQNRITLYSALGGDFDLAGPE